MTIIEIVSSWYLLDVRCACGGSLTTDGHHFAQCPDCLKVYECGCSPETQALECVAGALVCRTCGQKVDVQ